MYPLLELYEKRTQTAAAFCAERGLSQTQLGYWLRKYRAEAASVDGAALVEVTPPLSVGRAQVEVTYPSGIRMRFLAPVSASYLATLATS